MWLWSHSITNTNTSFLLTDMFVWCHNVITMIAMSSSKSQHMQWHSVASYSVPRFQWLWAPERIEFKPVVTVYRALHSTAPWNGCSTSLICRQDVKADCARRPPVFLTSACRGVSLSAIALLLLLAHDSGTVYLLTSSLPHHSQHFVRSSKLIYFGNHTQTLFFSCITIMVLDVTFTQATINSF